jgi:hypothetical protein
MAIAANQAPGSLGRYTPIIVALQTELAQLNGEAIEGYANYAACTADPSVIGDPLQPPPPPGVQAVGYDMPLTPPPADPPHGKDPRYWIDVTKDHPRPRRAARALRHRSDWTRAVLPGP